MGKFDEFKEFAKKNEFLKELVKNKSYSWQQLYEIFDIYGPESTEFKDLTRDEGGKEETMKEEKTVESKPEAAGGEKIADKGLGSLLDIIAGFNADKISEGLSGMKKILNVLSEVSKPEEDEFMTKRKMTRPYQRNDD